MQIRIFGISFTLGGRFLRTILPLILVAAGVILGLNENSMFYLLSVVGLVWYISVYNADKKRESEQQQEISNKQYEISSYTPSQQFSAYGKAISIDEKSNKLAISDLNNNYTFNFSDIIESEIIEDDSTITKTSRTSQIGGALVGGALAGGVGAVVGGLSGSKTSEKAVNKITLKIVVNNLQTPNFYIDFLNSANPLNNSDSRLIEARDKANHWHSLLSVIIKRQTA